MIVFVLRHADREPGDALSKEGLKRATLLARVLGDSGVQTAYRSQKIRARDTLRPLQDRLKAKLEVKPVDLDEDAPKDHVQQIIAAVKALPAGATAAVISHAGTVEPIIEGLTGKTIGAIKKHEFDKLFVLSITAAGVGTVAMLRYGVETPPPPT